MNELQVFQNAELGSVRTVSIAGIPYFVGKDVADILGYVNTRDALAKRVDEEDKGVAICDTLGGKQELVVINESGLYSLILSSKQPSAKKFKRWVTSEVLPSIRQHGVYASNDFLEKSIQDPEWAIGVLKQLKGKNDVIAMKNQQILEMAPKVSYYDLILQNKSVVNINQIAKDYGMSARAFNQLLFDFGVQYKQGNQWLLYQQHAPNGYTQSVTQLVNSGKKSVMHTKWTQKGRLFLYDLLKSKNIFPMIERGDDNA
ncbi:BRO-like protein [Lactococcus lactis RTB018]|uniref:Prophage protein n=1 Tax=Lactococcus lactis subsp. lactis TaxID=1360 RepID=A0A1V0NG04_LACLL|nr:MULTISPECIES: phage antirepressor [Lactococcus]ARD98868.1 prophage protein [Lactococcus lactis subsp. lactis]NHI69372.1 phage antirepressor [Lactococcus garvieae]NHJ06473.1 phage antirepressor [Lactococcus garvieae]OAZ17145.1 BRO-like protein [Lactococcus lactis RTB018]